jgi:hypothetical protein
VSIDAFGNLLKFVNGMRPLGTVEVSIPLIVTAKLHRTPLSVNCIVYSYNSGSLIGLPEKLLTSKLKSPTLSAICN